MYKTVSILGCGWLGLPLANHLLSLGHDVKGSTTQQDKKGQLTEQGIKAAVIDLTNETSDEWLPDFLQSEVLIVTVPPRSRTQAPGTYLAQMTRLSDAIKRQQGVRQLIYTSSTSVYPDRAGLVKESDVMDSVHAAHKELIEVEQLFLSIPGLSTAIVRLGGLTGGSRLLAKHFAGKKELKGGDQPVNLIHLEDAVHVIAWMMNNKMEGVFNACSPVHPNKRDFYTSLTKRFDMPLPEFKKEKDEGKTIDTAKVEQLGYIFMYPDPQFYTYDPQ